MLKRSFFRPLGVFFTVAVLAGSLPGEVLAKPSKSLTFATFNVCKSECESPVPRWDVRRNRVANVINESGADVVALNEATNQKVNGMKVITNSRGRKISVPLRQWDDIQGLTTSAGYVAPKGTEGACSCTHTARLLYKPSRVSQMTFGDVPSAGFAVQSDVTGSQGIIGSSRQVTWAYLDGGSGIGPFLAVSVHLDPDKSDSGERARTAFGRSLDTWVAGMHAARGLPAATPTVLMGDLNSFDARQPKGVQKILRSAGWKDAWDAPKRKNIDINSVNYSPTNRGGWPAKPIRNPSGVASRIDYIFYKGSGLKALSYEVVVRTDSAGRYVEKFRASDHNMVRAVISFS